MTAEADLEHCRQAIRNGSRSFYAASKLLPRRVSDPAQVLYAFCRLADDAVDLTTAKPHAVLTLNARLEQAYAGCPRNSPVDRAFADMIQAYELPRALPDALLEGLAWDAMERRYDTLSELRDYSARVASAVGAMMCVLMGARNRDALARACDLGVAMQLTNIARDVGEDAEAGRLYLPLEWLDEVGLDPEAFLADPRPGRKIKSLVRRLLAEAARLYFRSEAGISALPLSCRPGIYAARHIYARIGRRIAAADYDSITRRARTNLSEKLELLMLSCLQAGVSGVMPRSAVLHADPLPEVRFLVEAAARDKPTAETWGDGRAGAIFSVLAQLEAKDRQARIPIDLNPPLTT
ncbi:MAG: phytoene/squalene synthase family protein [Pseudomonadota bacterium]